MSLLYYGLTLNVENLHGDMYVNFAISAGMEGIAYTLAIPILSRIGRKKFNCVCMLVGAVALFAMVPLDLYAPECKLCFVRLFLSKCLSELTLCILQDFPIHIWHTTYCIGQYILAHTYNTYWPIVYFEGSRVDFL